MFGIFMRKKEIAAETAKSIFVSEAEKICSETISAMSSLLNASIGDRLSQIDEQLQQNLRNERRRQMALETIIENQNITIGILERMEMSPTLEALMSLAENLALTRIAQCTPEIDILYEKLGNLMKCFDLALISETGVNFDPERHEACGARCEMSSQDGVILDIVRPGFLLRDKVLRCSTVIVNRNDSKYVDSQNQPLLNDMENSR